LQGYLALTLLMHENSDIIRLVVNSIRKDLDDMNETTNCLALHAIANIGGADMAEALAPDVHRLLISPYVTLSSLSRCRKGADEMGTVELLDHSSRKRRL